MESIIGVGLLLCLLPAHSLPRTLSGANPTLTVSLNSWERQDPEGTEPDNLIHIHGDRDKIFPVKKINPTCIIKDGTHMIIYNRAGEISELIEKVL